MKASKMSSPFAFLLLLFIHLQITTYVHCYDVTALYSAASTLSKQQIPTRQSGGLTSVSRSSGGGLTFDQCREDEACATGRSCVLAENGDIRSCNPVTDLICLCIPESFELCGSPKDCSTVGETCVRIQGENQVCLSITAAQDLENSESFEIVDPEESTTPAPVSPPNNEIVDPEASPGPESDPDASTGPGIDSDEDSTSEAETHEDDTSIATTPQPNGESATPDSTSPTGGLTFDQCREDEACTTGRSCVHAENGDVRSCNSATDLVCLCNPESFELCGSPKDCSTVGETCIRFQGKDQFCISETVAQFIENSENFEIVDPEDPTNPETDSQNPPTPNGNGNTIPNQPPPVADDNPSINDESTSGDEDSPIGGTVSEAALPSDSSQTDDTGGACIAAKYLSHVPRQELVFETHTLAEVLCDHHGSCATSGHIVYYKGLGMMMRTYCNIIDSGCEKRKMLVNSPKWRRGLRISSSSPGMEYTAFAARYETRTEERVLRTAVRMGL